MGQTFLKNASANSIACETDDDCYKSPYSLNGISVATTDSEKSIRCCQYLGYITSPSKGTNTQ